MTLYKLNWAVIVATLAKTTENVSIYQYFLQNFYYKESIVRIWTYWASLFVVTFIPHLCANDKAVFSFWH